MQPSAVLQKAARRLPLTTKHTGRGFYKGTRTGSMGWHTQYGGYQIDWSKVRTYHVPDLTNFALTPFITKKVEAPKHRGYQLDDGAVYFKMWEEESAEKEELLEENVTEDTNTDGQGAQV